MIRRLLFLVAEAMVIVTLAVFLGMVAHQASHL